MEVIHPSFFQSPNPLFYRQAYNTLNLLVLPSVKGSTRVSAKLEFNSTVTSIPNGRSINLVNIRLVSDRASSEAVLVEVQWNGSSSCLALESEEASGEGTLWHGGGVWWCVSESTCWVDVDWMC